jgi:hypothetical protein
MLPASSKQSGQCFAMPDTCKTPVPGGPPVPIPYPNIGMVMQVTGESTKVKICNFGAVTKKTEMPRSMGDEMGTLGGVVSNVNMDKIVYKKGSSKVKVEGQALQHLTAMTGHNGMNANMPSGMQIAPSQVMVLVAE